MAWAEAYVRTKWNIDPFSRLATINGPKIGGCCPPFLAGSPSSKMSLWPRPTSLPSDILIHGILIDPAIWPQQVWAENWGRLCPFGGGGAGSPSNTMWLGPTLTCIPSFILICSTVWPQYTNVRDRTGQTGRETGRHTDNGPIT